jgi:hypothetical protein
MERDDIDGRESGGAGKHNGKNLTDIQIECFLRNVDQKHLVLPLRTAQLEFAGTSSREAVEEKRQAALQLQEQWDVLFSAREELRNEIKRGRECLEQIQKELASMRGELDNWASFEKTCGKNPLLDYADKIAAKERIQQFLPEWIKRRESQLAAVCRDLEFCAKQGGLEHLL